MILILLNQFLFINKLILPFIFSNQYQYIWLTYYMLIIHNMMQI